MVNSTNETLETQTVTPVSPTVSFSLWTVKQVADYLNIKPGTVYRMVERGELPAIRIGVTGRTLRFRQSEVEGWISGCQQRKDLGS